MLHFDTDYMRGAHPEVMRRLQETNLDQTTGYGTDPHTAHARELILQACGLQQGAVYFLAGGTQTNATVIDSVLARHEGVIGAETAHINVHEAGAVEATGHKVIALPAHNGKIDPAELEAWLESFFADGTYEHMVIPGMVYISQPTELGTLYSLGELEAISRICRSRGIVLYADGARLGYGLASEACDATLEDLARLADVFYIGGTKVGVLFGEAVVVTRPELFAHAVTNIKRRGALMAKGRLLGVQFETLFTDGLYLELAANAVDKAMQIKRIFTEAGYALAIDSPTNQQFFVLPNAVMDRLHEHATFELWGPRGPKETMVRFVTDWATSQADVDELARLVELAAQP